MKKRIILLVTVVAFAFCLVACGGNKLEGTWYSVCSDPANANDNITFSSDGTFMSDVTGTYVEDGDIIRLNFLGLTTVDFTMGDYNGTDALYESGHDTPEWCRTIEAAEDAYNNR